MVYNQDINLDLDTRQPNIIIGAKQYDNNSRTITATILENGKVLSIPSNALASYRIKKPNGRLSWKNAAIDYDKSQVKIILNSEDLSTSGRNIVDVVLTIGSFTLGTTNFILDVQSAPNINDFEQDSEALSHLEAIVQQANDMIEQAQAWAEGKRGDSPVVVDNYEVGAPDGLSVSLNFTTFKANITPTTAGSTITYTFTYGSNGWVYSYNAETVNMSNLGFTITALQENKPTYGDVITVVASYTDAAYQNNAKYYAEVAASAAVSLQSTITAVTSSLDTKLDIPAYQSSAPSNPKVGDFWVDNDAQFILNGAVISSENIQTSAVISSHIAPSAITAIHIAPGAITSAALTTGAVNGNAIQVLAISSNHIQEFAVQSNHLNNGAVTSYAISNNAIRSEHIFQSAITAAKISAGEVTAAKIATSAITSAKIAQSAIYANSLASYQIDLTKMSTDFMRKFGTVTSSGGYLEIKSLNSTYARGFILYVGKNARGLVAYNIETDGTSTGSGVIAGVTGSSGVTLQTFTSTQTDSGRLRLVNNTSTAFTGLVISLTGSVNVGSN